MILGTNKSLSRLVEHISYPVAHENGKKGNGSSLFYLKLEIIGSLKRYHPDPLLEA